MTGRKGVTLKNMGRNWKQALWS